MAAAAAAAGGSRRAKRRRCTPEQVEAWHVLDTLPRPEIGAATAVDSESAGRQQRHAGHWVRCTHGDEVLYWHSETHQLSLEAPQAGAHFVEPVTDRVDFDAMWAAAEQSDLDRSGEGSSDAGGGQLGHIADTLAAGAPGGGCSSSWGLGLGSASVSDPEQHRDRRVLLQEKREAARMAALVSQLRQCASQRYFSGPRPCDSEIGSDDDEDEDGLDEVAAATVEAVAVDCATMVTNLISAILQLRRSAAEPTVPAPAQSTKKPRGAAREEEAEPYTRVLDAAQLLVLPQHVSDLSSLHEQFTRAPFLPASAVVCLLLCAEQLPLRCFLGAAAQVVQEAWRRVALQCGHDLDGGDST